MTDMLTREELLRRAGVGAAMLSIPGLAAACGGGSSSGAGGATTQKLADTLHFANWPLYMDYVEKTKRFPTLDAFTKKTGVKVDYKEIINSNSEYFGKIQGPLSRGQSINEDLIVLTDNERYLSTMIKKGWVEELDKDAIPNIVNLVDVQKHPNFDPDRKYSLPWQSGMTGIAYNSTLTKPILSIDQLLEDKSLKGQITVLNSFADTLGLVMLSNGDDPSNVTDSAWKAALDRIKEASDSGQIRQFTGNDYTGPLDKGDLKACVAWSGDIVQLGNPKLKWNVPKDGGMIWTDNAIIPKGGDAYTASVYLNYAYIPAVAARIEAFIQYVPPVKGTREAMSKIDPALASNPLIFPTDATLEKVHLIDPDALGNQTYNEQWQAVLGA